jgi:transposase
MCTTFECRASPTPAQAANLARTFGCVRKVWNETLAWRHARYQRRMARTRRGSANRAKTAAKVAREGDACGGDVRHSGSSRVRSPKKQELPALRPRIPVLPGGE